MRSIFCEFVKYFRFASRRWCRLKIFPFCSAERNLLCNLVEDRMRNSSVKLFLIWTSGSDVF